MFTRLGQFFAREDVRRLLIVIAVGSAMIIPRPGRRLKPRPHTIPGLLATVCPVRPRRRFPVARPVRPLPPISTDDGKVALDSLRAILRAVRIAGHDAQKRVGLTAAQLSALRALDEVDPLSMNELADRTMTNASSASEVVTRLVSQGLVSRVRCEEDGRSVRLSLTDSGRLALAAGTGPEDEVRGALDKLPTAERRQLNRLLARLLENLAEGSESEAFGLQSASAACDPSAGSGEQAMPAAQPEQA